MDDVPNRHRVYRTEVTNGRVETIVEETDSELVVPSRDSRDRTGGDALPEPTDENLLVE